MQKNGAGLVSAASTYWDASKDGLCKVTWENGTMHCVVTVYGTCVNIDSVASIEHQQQPHTSGYRLERSARSKKKK